MPRGKKSESKYDDSRYVDWAIQVIKPAKRLKSEKKGTAKKNAKVK